MEERKVYKDQWISQEYEKNIKLWYQQVKKGNTDTLHVKLTKANDFLELQNFFLICQKETGKKLNLEILCEDEDEVFRVRHYLYICRELAGKIIINKVPYIHGKQVHFFRILPLISINKDSFKFLSMKVEEIETIAEIEFGKEFLKTLEQENKFDREKCSLLITALSSLYGDIKGFADFAKGRREYFENKSFKNKVRNMPFLAFLIFAVYDHVYHKEIAEKYKERKKSEERSKSVCVKIDEIPEAMPHDEEIEADIFSAWDLSDGILQLLENVVEHAAEEAREENIEKNKGLGVLSIRIHENSEYLENEYDQYFRGYENVYRKQYEDNSLEGWRDRTEKEYFTLCQAELRKALNRGYFVEEKTISEYDKVRERICERRRERKDIKYFLDIRISDMSGKNMCDVFRQNLIRQNYPKSGDFDKITVRSFFDPMDCEESIFENYYKGKNIIHHYGLQIFTSVVVNNDGFFYVRSHSTDDRYAYDTTMEVKEEELKDLFEGTRYKILLPFRRQSTNANSMINVDISYNMENLNKERVEDSDRNLITEFYEKLEKYNFEEELKEKAVCELAEVLSEVSGDLLEFDISKIKTSLMEIFCKAIILLIAEKNNALNIAITNCTTQNFVNIIRFFAVCYDKNGNNNWMNGTQVYLSGEDTREEFLLSGENINTLLVRVNKLAFSRKIHPMCIQTLQKVLEKKRQSTFGADQSSDGTFKYTPFDLILSKDGRTLFENNVKMVLENNIQNVESGCKIEPTHTRIGSKIHMDTFYEAELLFHNSYYTNRFAWLLFKLLQEELKEHGLSDINNRSVCFVGYETYSEMLLCELKKMWQHQMRADSAVYVVYEIRTDGTINIRYKELMQENMLYVFVVPINSTLTTFNKVHAEIEKIVNPKEKLPVIAYLGVIQIQDSNSADGELSDLEKVYWNKKDLVNRKIYSEKLLGKDNYARYLVDVQCKWENPLECEQCFPKDCILETPLIETNKASVVPTQLIGLKESIAETEDRKVELIEGKGNVESLKDYFYFGHIYRNVNHFQYYIRTANYFKNFQYEIKLWLEKVKDSINAKRRTNIVYFDIVVSPMHFSNTAFVEAVNEVVFHGASYVLRIETEKEFRDNIQTKYSDLRVLYENLIAKGNTTQINFYYVDDNIITGKAFHRVKHLVNSIFPIQKKNIKIFSSVIVLLNRLSNFSISNYVNNQQDYYAYIDLDISNLRSYEDACFLCKRESDNRKLAGYASTNIIYRYWKKEEEDYKLKSLAKVKKEYNEERNQAEDFERKKNKYFLRMLATHKLNQSFGNLGINKNDTLKVYEVLAQHMEEQKGDYEAMKSFLYVSASPFIVYRKSCKEAVFRMILIFLEIFINEDACEELIKRIDKEKSDKKCLEEYADNLKKMVNMSKTVIDNLNETISDITQKIDYLKFLIKMSVELKSNYIIREDRISRIIYKLYDLSEPLDKEDQIKIRNEFKIFFIAAVKKLIALNADESKSTRFEKELCPQIEGIEWNVQEEYADKENYLNQIKIALYLENTSGIVDAIKNLEKTKGDIKEYFFENYLKILQANGLKENTDIANISDMFRKLYIHLNMPIGDQDIREGINDFHKYIDYYNKLAMLIKELISAKNVQFLLAHNEWILKVNENHDVVFDKETSRYEVFAHSENAEIAFKMIDDEKINQMIQDLSMETIAINQNYVLVKYSGYGKEQNYDSYFQPVYMIVEYAKNVKKVRLDLVKRILVYRNMMMQRFADDFYNNVMQNWIRQSRVIEQLEKARAFIHTRDNDDGDISNVWLQCKAFFYGREEDIQKQEKEFGKMKDGYILELMTDIRIGRINLLLLSNSKFRKDTIKSPHKFLLAKGHLECLKRAYYWKDICICDMNGEPKQNIIDDEVYEAYLEKNRDGYYNLVNEYLIYLIYETVHSAAIYGKKKEDKVHISIYKEGIYLYICNTMKSETRKKAVYDGIARKGKGISLAVVCEYFIKEYRDRYVKLYTENNQFKIGLPIFAEEKKDAGNILN